MAGRLRTREIPGQVEENSAQTPRKQMPVHQECFRDPEHLNRLIQN